MHSINLIFLFHVCDSLFFNWLHSNLSRTRACTHTHIHGLLVHPLIPNCLRKRRGEIPLQCLGSALCAGWRRALRSVSPRCAIPSLTHVESVPSERSVWLNRPFFFFSPCIVSGGPCTDRAYVWAAGAASEHHGKLNWKVFLSRQWCVIFVFTELFCYIKARSIIPSSILSYLRVHVLACVTLAFGALKRFTGMTGWGRSRERERWPVEPFFVTSERDSEL